MGVLHGIRALVPRMLERGEEGHIVNTASMAGLLTSANPYNVSKHAIVCLTEGIYKEFKAMGAKLSASVLCPGLINIAILDAELVLESIRHDKFYIFPAQEGVLESVRLRAEDIVEQRNPIITEGQ